MELRQFFDGQYINEEYDKLLSFMRTQGLLQSQDSSKASFTGILNVEDVIYIFMPKGFRGSRANNTLQNGRLLLSVLKKYVLSGRGSVVSVAERQDGVSGVPAATALELLQDYMRFGTYSSSQTEVSQNQAGKIEWNTVLNKLTPFLRKDCRPIYTSIYTRRTNYFAENDVTLIHQAIIARLDKIFGWFYTDNQRGVAPELKDIDPPYNNEKAIAIVRKELAQTYSDREIRLLNNIIKILSHNLLSNGASDYYSGITNFQHVWEDICSQIYQDEKSRISRLVPIPAYLIGNTIKSSEANTQRMDVIIEQDNKIAILDAKYYNFSQSKPSWSDLVKQFYYKRSLSAVLPSKRIENFFLAPEADAADLPNKAVVISSQQKRLDHEFSPISIIYLNVEEAMSAYLGKNDIRDYRAEIFSKYYI